MKNKYEELFDSFLSITDFRLVKYLDGFGLIDLQGVNLGEIESDRFKTAEDIFDRMDIYIKDYFITDINELLDEKDIEVTWDNTCELYLKHAKPLLPGYNFDFDILDMICYHADEIDLNNCNYEMQFDAKEIIDGLKDLKRETEYLIRSDKNHDEIFDHDAAVLNAAIEFIEKYL